MAGRPNRLPFFGTATVSLGLGLAAMSGCGGSDDKENASPATGFDSAYCVTARTWAARELDGSADGAYASDGPDGLETWWNEQLAYLKTSVRQAPPAIHDAEALYEQGIRTKLTPLLRKYGFDLKRIDSEASASEKAFAEAPPARYVNAEEARDLYQNRVCGNGGTPPPAPVKFTKSAASKAYCAAAAAQETGLGAVASSKFDPDAFRKFATSNSFLKALDDEDATAPAEIAADVKADNQWVRTRKLAVLKDYGYDLRRLLREGRAEELAAFTYWDPEIRTQDSRVEAYVAQVCGGGP